MRYLFGRLLADGAIVRVARNCYKKNQKSKEKFIYIPNYSEIADRLIGESPRGVPMFYNVCLEKIIVDLFVNKKLQNMISQ